MNQWGVHMEGSDRYRYHLELHEIGSAGQRKLASASVAVVGTGAVGTVIADRLARVGIGYLRVIDHDVVELKNLQRQSLYDERDAEKRLPKVVAAKRRLRRINSEVAIDACNEELVRANCGSLLGDVDLVLDGTDNLGARWAINDYVFESGKAWIYGGVGTTGGAASNVLRPGTPCLRCIEDTLLRWARGSRAAEPGLLSTAPVIVGCLEATEAIRFVVEGCGSAATRRLTLLDAWTAQFRTLEFGRREDCPCCGKGRSLPEDPCAPV